MDVNNAQTWIYTFIDINEYSLNKVFKELKKYNYQLNTLSQNSKGTWTLEVKREEVLTPKKLAKRNLAFQELAMKYHVDLYVGWSVVKD